MFKKRTYGPWQLLHVTHIKDGHKTYETLSYRKKPNGTLEWSNISRDGLYPSAPQMNGGLSHQDQENLISRLSNMIKTPRFRR